MKKKYRLKKSAITGLVIFFFLIATIIYLSLFDSKSYSLEYNIFDYAISENYDKEKEAYYIEIEKEKIIYPILHKSAYLKEKKLIKDIKEYSAEDYKCLIVSSSLIKTYPICSNKKDIIDYHLVPEELKAKISDYYKTPQVLNQKLDQYELYSKDDEVFIWSYKGFNRIKDGKKKFIKIFDEDIYEIPLATKINNYIFIPDYEQKYNFNRAYIINLETLEVKKWNLKYNISFDSYVLGINEKSIYIMDKKNKIEYELVPEKKKMRILAKGAKSGIIYNKGVAQHEPLSKLSTRNYHFIYENIYNYTLDKHTLYLNYIDSNTKIKTTNQKVKHIVAVHQNNVYYLVDNTLYRYNLSKGEVPIIKYTEWTQNYKNLIFINN